MKEDLLKIINNYGIENQLKYIHSEYFELDEANKETKRLHSIIKEAIEYIELWHYRNDYRVNSFTTECKNDLLEILKGSDSNEIVK